MAPRITSVGFIGSGRLAERIARKLITKIPPQKKFCYEKQRLVSTLLASDPSEARRQVFDDLGFTTTATNQRIMADCDIVFLGTNAREALQNDPGLAERDAAALPYFHHLSQIKQTLFVSLMGDLPAEQIEQLICPGAKVIRMMPQNYLEMQGLPKGMLPESSWATVRGTHASEKDMESLLELAGIKSCVQICDHFEGAAENRHSEGPISSFVRTITDYSKSMKKEHTHDDVIATDFHDDYQMGEFLGTGRFCDVFKATEKATGTTYAVKCLKNEELTTEAVESLIAEVGALNRLKHPNVITHHGFYAEGDKYYLVLDHCDQGSVQRLLNTKKPMPEQQAKHLIRQILTAVEYCHSMGQVHRDIKAENVLLASGPSDGEFDAKLADFGLSEELALGVGRSQGMCGTPQYLSPELVSGRLYGKPADIWSTGILGYMLLSGRIPFDEAHNEAELYKLISLGAIWYNGPEWSAVSAEGKAFIKRMLDMSPDSRATATELLGHPWLQ